MILFKILQSNADEGLTCSLPIFQNGVKSMLIFFFLCGGRGKGEEINIKMFSKF